MRAGKQLYVLGPCFDLYEALPVEQRAVGGVHGARIDLATAHCQGDGVAASGSAIDLDAAREVLTPTFALPPERRTERLAARMRMLRPLVGAGRFRGALQAASLAEEIEEFTASGLGRQALPAGS